MKNETETCRMPNKGPQGLNVEAVKRLKRAEGQIRGVIRLVDDEAYCPDILTQIAAARAALRKAGLGILKRHVKACVSDAVRAGESQGKSLIDEMMTVLDRYGI